MAYGLKACSCHPLRYGGKTLFQNCLVSWCAYVLVDSVFSGNIDTFE